MKYKYTEEEWARIEWIWSVIGIICSLVSFMVIAICLTLVIYIIAR
jgi:hypothetical protein